MTLNEGGNSARRRSKRAALRIGTLVISAWALTQGVACSRKVPQATADSGTSASTGDSGVEPPSPQASISQTSNSATDPQLAPLEAEAASSYVAGFPLHVAISVRAKDPAMRLNRLPLANLGLLNGVGVTLTRNGSSSAPAVEKAPEPFVDEEAGMVGFSLRPGERRRMLLDLSALAPEGLPPGDYTLKLSYRDELESEAHAAPLRIQIRAPSSAEQTELELLRPELERARSWEAWAQLPLAPGAKPPAARKGDPLLYYRVLRYLRDPRTNLPQVNMSLLESLGSPYRAEAALLKAELLSARGNQPAFDRQERKIAKQHPGYRWWLDAIKEGRTELRARHRQGPWLY